MAKYDSQLSELKNLLPGAKSILIALPTNASIDQLSAGLALFLTLEAAGKQVSIVCDDTIKVGQSHLFGIDHVQKNIPSTEGGNLTLTLEGVAASDNTVPALEKLDWYSEGNNLNLVFHVLPGQTFQPAKIVPHYQGSGFNLIFVVGSVNLNALGKIYLSNPQAFSGGHIVNIDTQSSNTSFGQTNVLDTNASSVSEVMTSVITDLGLNLDGDTASNLLAGIFDVTANLTDPKVTADTYMAVASCLRVGGRKPQVQTTPTYDLNALMPASPAQRGEPKSQPALTIPVTHPQVTPVDAGDHIQPVNVSPSTMPANQPSPEERPVEEGVYSETVEPEWLTPKIFKGSSLG